MGLELTAWTAAASRRLDANTWAAQKHVMFCCTGPSLSGIPSLCKTQKQLCALEDASQSSIGAGMSIGWRNYLYCSFRGAGNSILNLLSLWIPPDEAAAAGPDELLVDRSYVKKKLEHGLTRIWQVSPSFTVYFIVYFFDCPTFFFCVSQVCSARSSSLLSPQDVQLKVKAYILGTDMSNFKYDDFIVVLDVISRYASGGDSPASSPLSLLIGCHRPHSCCPSSPNCPWTSFF